LIVAFAGSAAKLLRSCLDRACIRRKQRAPNKFPEDLTNALSGNWL
jgi:hypothetical protein